MKWLLYPIVFTAFLFYGCSKSNSSSDGSPFVRWQLVQRDQYIVSEKIITPSADSAVYLLLGTNNVYHADLNSTTISSGSYAITVDAYEDSVLELKSFKTTGIFSLFVLEEINSNDQIVSIYNGLSMRTMNDTLTLSTAPTPGGFTSYIFVKR
jgi:hypothetical protein